MEDLTIYEVAQLPMFNVQAFAAFAVDCMKDGGEFKYLALDARVQGLTLDYLNF